MDEDPGETMHLRAGIHPREEMPRIRYKSWSSMTTRIRPTRCRCPGSQRLWPQGATGWAATIVIRRESPFAEP